MPRGNKHPSAESLKEMPEMNFDAGRFVKSKGTEAFALARKYFAVVRGRPKKGERAAGSKARSLRLPDEVWADLEEMAKQRGVSVHKLLRMFVALLLYTETWNEKMAAKEAKATAQPEFKGKSRMRRATPAKPEFKGRVRVRKRVRSAAA